MATKSNTTADANATAGTFDAAEQSIQRIRELNEQLVASSKASGLATLDAYEKTLRSLATFEESVAEASQLDWISALATAHSKFVQDVSAVYTNAAREQLK
jgi:hypothetical protein